MLPLLNDFARMPLCGLIAWYNGDRSARPLLAAEVLPALLVKRVQMQGFVIIDQYPTHHDAFQRDMQGWLAAGKMTLREDVVDGLEQAPAAFIGLLEGRNFGKLVVRVAADEPIG